MVHTLVYQSECSSIRASFLKAWFTASAWARASARAGMRQRWCCSSGGAARGRARLAGLGGEAALRQRARDWLPAPAGRTPQSGAGAPSLGVAKAKRPSRGRASWGAGLVAQCRATPWGWSPHLARKGAIMAPKMDGIAANITMMK